MAREKMMEEEPSRNRPSSVNFEAQLQDVIVHHLNLLSADGKEKVLDYINTLIDLEQKKVEFERRQGRLYNWSGFEGPGS